MEDIDSTDQLNPLQSMGETKGHGLNLGVEDTERTEGREGELGLERAGNMSEIREEEKADNVYREGEYENKLGEETVMEIQNKVKENFKKKANEHKQKRQIKKQNILSPQYAYLNQLRTDFQKSLAKLADNDTKDIVTLFLSIIIYYSCRRLWNSNL
jgi:hypothetical protein